MFQKRSMCLITTQSFVVAPIRIAGMYIVKKQDWRSISVSTAASRLLVAICILLQVRWVKLGLFWGRFSQSCFRWGTTATKQILHSTKPTRVVGFRRDSNIQRYSSFSWLGVLDAAPASSVGKELINIAADKVNVEAIFLARVYARAPLHTPRLHVQIICMSCAVKVVCEEIIVFVLPNIGLLPPGWTCRRQSSHHGFNGYLEIFVGRGKAGAHSVVLK